MLFTCWQINSRHATCPPSFTPNMLFLAFDRTLLFRQETYAPSNLKMLATAKNPASIAILATNKSTRREILWVHAQCGSLDGKPRKQ